MRAPLGFLVSITLLAGAAQAQPPAAPAAAAAEAAPATKPASPGPKVVEGLTVVGKTAPAEPCSSRDKDCIALVVAELKTRYPEQLKRFCFSREVRSVRSQMIYQRLEGELGDAPTPTAFGENSALKTACRAVGK